MEVFIEYMVKRKKTAIDYLKVALSLFAGFFVIFVLLNFVFVKIIGTFVMLAIVGVIYLLYYLITSINLEYEYILTNTDIDIDKIINAKKRKRITTVNLKAVECFGNKKSAEYNRYSNSQNIKKLFACHDFSDENNCFVVFKSGEQNLMLLFDPNEKIIERIKALNPQKVFMV